MSGHHDEYGYRPETMDMAQKHNYLELYKKFDKFSGKL
jgi:hypothetical protein